MEIIAQHETIFYILALAFGLYMTWGIGANDVANAMGTSVGSGAIGVREALIIAALFEFSGAFFASSQVTATIQKGIIHPAAAAAQPELLVYGMLGALLSAAIWLTLATQRGWPVSTTHSIVGAILGFAVVGLGTEAVQWEQIGEIAIAWAIAPFLAGVLALALMLSIRTLILNAEHPFRRAKVWGPLYVFLVGFIVSLVTLFRGLSHIKLELSEAETLLVAAGIGLVVALIGRMMIAGIKMDRAADRRFHFASVEKVFVPMMIFTACAMAFAHGSNDVANGIGPLAAVLSAVESAKTTAAALASQKAAVPLWVPILGAAGIVAGIATLGYRVMQTIGTRITSLTPTSGYSATLAAAVIVVLASKVGLPLSTTQVAVGAVMGVGFARGLGAVDLRVVANILLSWLVTLPANAVLSIGFFFLFKYIFG